MTKTWGEIKEDVLALGFEETDAFEEYKEAFISATNRAISFVASTVIPILGKYTIKQYPVKNLLGGYSVVQYRGTELIYSAENVKAYYFEIEGEGTAEIDGIEFEVETGVYKDYAEGTVTIKFKGDNSYLVKNIAMYDSVGSEIPEFVPYKKYDLKELTKEDGIIRFARLSENSPVKQSYTSDSYYEVVGDYEVENKSVIVLKADEYGEFDVWYEKLPQKITDGTSDDYEVEIDYQATLLIPLLVAHYVWLDDDSDKALLYLDQFNDMSNRIKQSEKARIQSPSFKSVTGWW